MLTYDFRLPPGPRTVEYALLAEELGFRAVWCPEIPAFGHDIWVTLARIAERTKRIKFGPSVLIPSYRHPMAQASAIATLEQIAPGRLMVGFGTGFTGRAGMGKKPLSLTSMRTHIAQVKTLLRGKVADIDGGLAQILASDGWLPDRPINVPVYMAGQGPKARALAKEITDGLISLGGPAEGFETCLVSTNGTVLDDGEDVTSPRASTAVRPLVALAYHLRYTTDPESVKALPNGEAVLALRERWPHWGPKKLRVKLGELDPALTVPAASTIGDWLRREGLVGRLRQRRRCPAYTQPFAAVAAANDVWCTDFKGWFRTADGRRCDPFTPAFAGAGS